jgi:hypothetical protein
MSSRAKFIAALMLPLLCLTAGAQVAPIPPSGTEQGAGPEAQPASEVVPDRRPLSGAQDGGLGIPVHLHGTLEPRIAVSQAAGSNAALKPGEGRGYGALTSVAGEAQLLQFWRNGQLYYDVAARYDSLNDFIHLHSLAISHRLTGRRASFLLSNEFGYTPVTDFGFAGMQGVVGLGSGGLGVLGRGQAGASNYGTPSLNASLNPNQSIMTQLASRIANTSAAELEYRLTARSSVTATASHGLIRSLESELLAVNQYNGGLGYNFALTRRTDVALTYGYGRFDYADTGRRIHSHSIAVLLGRTLLGQLRITGGGGAQRFNIRDPHGRTHDITWDTRAGLQYRRGSRSVAAEWIRGVTAGSGVLDGTITNNVNLASNWQLTQLWAAYLMVGYAHNKALKTHGYFESEYVGVGLNRRLGRYLGVYFDYNMQHQKGVAVCAKPICGAAFLQHLFSVGLTWTPRPVGIF